MHLSRINMANSAYAWPARRASLFSIVGRVQHERVKAKSALFRKYMTM